MEDSSKKVVVLEVGSVVSIDDKLYDVGKDHQLHLNIPISELPYCIGIYHNTYPPSSIPFTRYGMFPTKELFNDAKSSVYILTREKFDNYLHSGKYESTEEKPQHDVYWDSLCVLKKDYHDQYKPVDVYQELGELNEKTMRHE